MTTRRLRLAFISTVFLLPADAGGKIRTGNVLRGMKGGPFEITLISPASVAQAQRWSSELQDLCDHFVPWDPRPERPRWTRAVDLLRELPANVANDATAVARRTVAAALAPRHGEAPFDVVVFDFVHAAVLMPPQVAAATVCFTHNVEAEIFDRHAKQAGSPPMRQLWAAQARKMKRFEHEALQRFDRVVAVSERDAVQFRQAYRLPDVQVIPTGVDLDFFSWQAPPPVDAAHPPTVVFTGSMDWAANIDGVRFFLAEVWPLVLASRPEARFVVVGRNAPAALVHQAAGVPGVTFTGFVDDVRPPVRHAHVFVIPLRVGGGTRIKAFEAMAMGCPVVSTRIGIEGLGVVPGEHFIECDAPADQAAAIVGLFDDAARRMALSTAARELVTSRFGHRVAAQVFERICLGAGQAAAPAQRIESASLSAS